MIVSLDRIDVSIGSKLILSDISLSLSAGEVVSLVGPNGAGKSTLLKALTGMVSVSSGKAMVLDQNISAKMSKRQLRSLRAHVGQIFQSLHLVPRLSVLENVLIGRLSKNRSVLTWARIFSKADHEIVNKALAKVGMNEFAHKRVDQLSGGERQKVAIARALAQEAKIILADEPTANLDPRASLEIAALLRKLAADLNLGVITAVHTVSLLEALGGRVVGLKNGRVVFDSRAADISGSKLTQLYGRENEQA